MKGMKGKLLKKLKSIKPIGHLKPDRILQVSAADGFVETLLGKSNFKIQTQFARKGEEPEKTNQSSVAVQEPEIIDVSDLMKDLEDDEKEERARDELIDDKENITPEKKAKNPVDLNHNLKIWSSSKLKNSESDAPLSEINYFAFRPPDLESGSLFDPNLLAAFEEAVMEVKAQEAERRARVEEPIGQSIEGERPMKARKIEEIKNPLLDFEEKCPPGGEDSVVLYTTGVRGIRKTFEDCTSIRFLLQSFRLLYFERDVSMHSEFKEELWRILGEKVVPPKLFIKGRYIGGADVVLVLHEQGKLRCLFDGIPLDHLEGPCEGCAGVRFVMCFSCNGSRKVVSDDNEIVIQCPECNENGLIICPMCC